jgi:hypothetical protein
MAVDAVLLPLMHLLCAAVSNLHMLYIYLSIYLHVHTCTHVVLTLRGIILRASLRVHLCVLPSTAPPKQHV